MLIGPHTCVVCKKNPVFANASEKLRFQELQRTVTDFQMPRRCWECRREARKPIAAPSVEAPYPIKPLPVFSAPPPAPSVTPPAANEEVRKEEIRLVLATKDFEDLVHGRAVVWQGVRVILADIGFKVMKDAVDRAETSRAREVFHRNGST